MDRINDTNTGIYNGGRYEFYIRLDNGGLFEYSISDVQFKSDTMDEAYSRRFGFLNGEELVRVYTLSEKYPKPSYEGDWKKTMEDKAFKTDDVDLLEYLELLKKISLSLTIDLKRDQHGKI